MAVSVVLIGISLQIVTDWSMSLQEWKNKKRIPDNEGDWDLSLDEFMSGEWHSNAPKIKDAVLAREIGTTRQNVGKWRRRTVTPGEKWQDVLLALSNGRISIKKLRKLPKAGQTSNPTQARTRMNSRRARRMGMCLSSEQRCVLVY